MNEQQIEQEEESEEASIENASHLSREARLLDIDAQIAYHLDGWRWVAGLSLHDVMEAMLQPPANSKEYERTGITDDCIELQGWEIPYPRSQFWYAHGGRWNSRKGLWEFGFQHPTTDPVATAHVREWLRGQRYLVIQKEMPDGVSFRHDESGADLPGFRSVAELHGGPAGVTPSKILATGQTVEEAVCLVALQLIALRKDS